MFAVLEPNQRLYQCENNLKYILINDILLLIFNTYIEKKIKHLL